MAATRAIKADSQAPGEARRLVAAAGLALALGYLVFLAGSFAQGHFLLDRQGRGIANDFVNVWAAGRLVLQGKPAAPYDAARHRAAQETAVGHVFEGEYRWHYPPPFLFAAAAAAMLPFAPAALAWLMATGLGYVASIRAILGGRAGMLFACGFPGALWTVTAGQNGFLATALVGGSLVLMDRRPALAGCLLGLLTVKPQLGVLFPLILAATGRWRVIAWAAASGVLLALLSLLAFGAAPWRAFAGSLAAAKELVLADGGMGWGRLQSVFGLVRALGGGERIAWAVHGTLAAVGTLALCALWRSRLPYELKAAGLAVGVVLATPYLFVYDLVLLAVPMAFLLRLGLARGFFRCEAFLLPAAGALILSYLVVPAQVGLAAALIVAALVGQRALACPRAERPA